MQQGNTASEKKVQIPERYVAIAVGDGRQWSISLTVHGGWLHLFGDMLFLWIFGDNVEDNKKARHKPGPRLLFRVLRLKALLRATAI